MKNKGSLVFRFFVILAIGSLPIASGSLVVAFIIWAIQQDVVDLWLLFIGEFIFMSQLNVLAIWHEREALEVLEVGKNIFFWLCGILAVLGTICILLSFPFTPITQVVLALIHLFLAKRYVMSHFRDSE